jgi:hypothetical protein
MADEIAKLSEELRREQKEWRYKDHLKQSSIGRWWDAIAAEEEELAKRRALRESLGREEAMRAIHTFQSSTIPYY